jgi:hypothetical protein
MNGDRLRFTPTVSVLVGRVAMCHTRNRKRNVTMKDQVAPYGEFIEMSHEQLSDAGKLGTCDWKAAPADVLEQIDKLLKPHGLEVVLFEARGDEYEFTITARGADEEEIPFETPTPSPPASAQ